MALLVGGVAILAAAMLISSVSPVEAVKTLILGSLGSRGAIAGTLRETTPLLIAGVAVYLALRAGLFNIGVEGQLLVGAAAATAVALKTSGSAGFMLAAAAGVGAGALWALPAGWIRAYRSGHEVITTIMLNNVAVYFTGWLLANPMKDPQQQSPTTVSIDASTRLPNLYSHPPLIINVAIVVGVTAATLLAIWLKRTIAGFELEAVGANPRAAQFAGIDPKRTMLLAMTSSGAIAGLAGAVQVLAYEGRFYAGFSPGYGFDSLGVALLAGNNALGVLPASLLFGILAKGGTALQIEGVPKGITTVILGFLILLAAAIRYRKVNAVA
ncbi:MAG: ABC transporter permease [Fimbriimonas sp.]